MFEINHNVEEEIIEVPDILYQPSLELEFTCHMIDKNQKIVHFFFCESENIFHYEFNYETKLTIPTNTEVPK